MDIQGFREKVLYYCKIVDKNQRALAQELNFHPTALSNKLNENEGRKLVNSEVKAIIKILVKWEAITEAAEIIELLNLKGLKLSIFTKEELSNYPLSTFELEPATPGSRGSEPYKQPPNNLPAQTTSLIGREDDVKAVRSMLSGFNTRLLILTGPGGTGKTRLSLQVAREVLDAYEHGVFFVELAAITNPDLVPQAIAKTVGLAETKDNPLVENLKYWLSEKQLLLVLDNFEQVQGAASFVGELVITCPGLKILVTSREVLHVYGEKRFIVPTLAWPDMSNLPAFETLPKYAAVVLFVERAQGVKRDFTIDGNLAAISEICALLDGLPLAIELVAARSNIFTPQALLSRLKNRLFQFTSGPQVNLPKRHQSLQNAIDWSFDLLNLPERELLIRLSVFPLNASLESIETICNVEEDLPLDILEVLYSLVNKSLLNSVSDPAGEPRFGMLATVREYAFEKLIKAGLADIIKKQHTAYFLTLGEEAFQHINKPDQAPWFDRLNQEHLNSGAAIRNSLTAGEIETALRFGGALGRYWQNYGYLSEGCYWLTKILEQAGDNPDEPKEFTLLKARAINMLALLKLFQGELDASKQQYDKCLAIFQEFGDLLGVSACYKGFGNIAYYRNDLAGALDYFDQGLNIIIDQGNKKEIADYLNNMAVIATNMGDLERARELNERSLAFRREMGDKKNVADSLNNIGVLVEWGGEFEKAVPYLEESLNIRREIAYKQGIADSLNNLAEVYYYLGNLERAAEFSKEGLILHQELGDKIGHGICLGELATISDELGRYDEALEYARANLLLRSEIKDRRGITLAFEEFGFIAANQQDLERAVKLLGFAECYRKEIGFERRKIDDVKHDNKIRSIRAALTEPKFNHLWGEASNLTLDDVMILVLGQAEGETNLDRLRIIGE